MAAGGSEPLKGPRHLHPKVKIIWFAPSAAALFIFWMLSSAFFIMAPDGSVPNFGVPKIAVPFATLAIIALLLAAPIYLYLHIEYLSFTYELTADEVVIREGVFTRRTTMIPYARIQNIHTKRTVLERVIGLASLQIETAGANLGASEGILPGIMDKEILIAEIFGHVEKVKKVQPDGLGSPMAGEKYLKDETALLSEILKELVQLNKNISSHYDRGSPAHGGSRQ